ncbi:MAG: tRNA lysidine(34) synthetase TilS [Fodinibius sp.]|nr:tRNA lysidine(34) synthetase TilS [Fodinibius sp.]
MARVAELPALQTGRAVELVPGIRILRDREHYVIATGSSDTFEPVVLERDKLDTLPLNVGRFALAVEIFDDIDFGDALFLDVNKMAWPLTVRLWRAGDQLQPLGMEGHQQVAEHLTNRKVPAVEKKKALVVESFDKTICAIIFPPIKNQTPPGTISDQVKCDAETEQCLRITFRT